MSAKIKVPPVEDLKGLTPVQIAFKFKVSYSTAQGWLTFYGIYQKGMGIKRSPKSKPIPPKEKLENKSLSQIMAENKIGPFTAHKWLAFYNLETDHNFLLQKKNMEQSRMIERYRKIGFYGPAFLVLTDAQLARAFHLSRERIRQIRNKMGWPCYNKFSLETLDGIEN